MRDVLIGFLLLIVFIVGVFVYYVIQSKKKMGVANEDALTHDIVVEKLTRRIVDMTKTNTFRGKDDREWRMIYDKSKRIEEALIGCVLLIEKHVITTHSLFVAILEEIFTTKEQLLRTYPFEDYNIDPMWQFEILMERLYPVHKKDTYAYLVKKYQWDRERFDEEGRPMPYYVSEEDLYEAYKNEIITDLTFRELLSVTATLLMSEMKTPGILTTLLMQNIDGVNAGVSGSLLAPKNNATAEWRGTRSVWVYFQGKYIHNTFFDFRSHEELKRCCQLIGMYGNPGPLTVKRTYLVNTMADKSRVLIVRPPAGECWALFIRKFVLRTVTLDSLINPPILDLQREPVKVDGVIQRKFKNAELATKLIEFIMETETNCIFTGRQGSGKTQIMIASIAKADARHNVRAIEMSPELYFREQYVRRNMYSVQETPYTSAQDLQDATKKSDATITITAEIATDIVALKTLQLSQLNAIATYATHHANRPPDLVNALTNSAVAATGGGSSPEIMLPQVLDFLAIDCHLNYDVKGNRYIERITEIIPTEKTPYPDREPGESAEEYSIRLKKEYYTRITDRKLFTWQDIIKYNPKDMSYEIITDKEGNLAMFTEERLQLMFSRLREDRKDYWLNWLEENWGGK